MTKHKYEIEQLKEAASTSRSIRQVLEKLNIIPAGGNYATVNKLIKEHNINTSHFTGAAWNKGLKIGPKKQISHYLNKNKSIQTYKLKNRLINAGIFDHQCQNCKLKDWLNKPIPLELHHKDGDNSNNELSNLSMLCPNCHALTDNYRGKNKKQKVAEAGIEPARR